MATTSEPQLVLPKLERVPFDDLVGEILVALERRQWQVPGVSVRFATDANGQYRSVQAIWGDSFRLIFGPLSDDQADSVPTLTDITIPRRYLQIRPQGTLYLHVYTGYNWEQNPEILFPPFESGSDRALYVGQLEAGATFKLEPRLNHHAQQGRAVSQFTMSVIFTEFRHWLDEQILRLAQGAPLKRRRVLKAEAPQPVPKGLEHGVAFGTEQEAAHIYARRHDPTAAQAWPCGLPGGQQLCELVNGRQNRFYENPRPALLGPVLPTTAPASFRLPWSLRHRQWRYVFRLKLNRANDIFVCDLDPIHPPERPIVLGSSWLKPVVPPTAAVPLADYTGDYRHPVLLLGRPLDDGEVELVSGPWPEYDLLRRVRQQSELRQVFDQLTCIRPDSPELENQVRQFGERLAQDEELRLAIKACAPAFRHTGLDLTIWSKLVQAWRYIKTYEL